MDEQCVWGYTQKKKHKCLPSIKTLDNELEQNEQKNNVKEAKKIWSNKSDNNDEKINDKISN